jgi:probable F420-dependent oxidoreductase
VKFAIAFANIGPCSEPGRAIEFARAAEAAGFESLWTVEHVVVPADYQSTYPYDPSGRMPGPENAPMPDPLVWLSFLASATSTLRLATGILVLPQRNPVVLAKELATLDHLSGGRLLLGVGSGWLEEEFEAIGIPFAERGRRTDDALGALRALWAEEPASYEGDVVQRLHPESPAGWREDPGPRRWALARRCAPCRSTRRRVLSSLGHP